MAATCHIGPHLHRGGEPSVRNFHSDDAKQGSRAPVLASGTIQNLRPSNYRLRLAASIQVLNPVPQARDAGVASSARRDPRSALDALVRQGSPSISVSSDRGVSPSTAGRRRTSSAS